FGVPVRLSGHIRAGRFGRWGSNERVNGATDVFGDMFKCVSCRPRPTSTRALEWSRRNSSKRRDQIRSPLTVCESGGLSGVFLQNNVQREVGRDIVRTTISEFCKIEAAEQILAGAHHDGTEHEMQLVDEPGAKVLANRRGAAADADVLFSRG